MARDSSGPKNEPQYSGLGAPADAADLTEVGAYAARYGNFAAETSTARGARVGTDLWIGLTVYETDTGLVWVYNAGWSIQAAPSVVRDYQVDLAATLINSGVTIATLAIPAVPVVSRLVVNINGTVGFNTAALYGMGLTASAGTITEPTSYQVTVAAGIFGQFAHPMRVDLSANTATTLTVKSNSAAVGYYRGIMDVRVWLNGEFA